MWLGVSVMMHAAVGHKTMSDTTNIAICVITYKRPVGLCSLLESLQAQRLVDASAYQVKIIVVDNEVSPSCRRIIEDINASALYPVIYDTEAKQGIPYAREKSVQLAWQDDALIFVDDDEVAPQGWLQALLQAWKDSKADVVTGPVRGILPENAPIWAERSDIYHSTNKRKTGDYVSKAYTNNTLVSQHVYHAITPAFDPVFRYTGSSDLHFFQRVHSAGYKIYWCEEAVIYEDVPPSRLTWGWVLKRAFRAGSGDAISRMLIKPGFATTLKVLAYAAARFSSGVFYVLIGGVGLQWPRITKGVRRMASGVGTVAGLFGLNYEEYRSIHGE